MNTVRNPLSTAAALSLCLAFPGPTHALDGAVLYKEKVCNTCHGETGTETILSLYPKIAGQNADYSVAQMKDIRDGRRTNGLSAAMRAVVNSVTDEQFQAIAEWLASN